MPLNVPPPVKIGPLGTRAAAEAPYNIHILNILNICSISLVLAGVLFRSEDYHNVSPVTRGVRNVLVIELWAGPTNGVDRNQ